MTYVKLTAAAFVVVLTGCGQGSSATAEAGSDATTGEAQTSVVERVMGIFKGSTLTATTTTPGMVLVGEVIEKACPYPLNGNPEVFLEAAERHPEQVIAPEMFTLNLQRRVYPPPCYLAWIAQAGLAPSVGWVDGINEMDQIRVRETATYAANGLYGYLLAPLEKQVFKDSQDAENVIYQRLKSLPDAAAEKILGDATREGFANGAANRTVDGVSGKGQQWQKGGENFNYQADGTLLTRNGNPWFGSGWVAGRRYQLQLAKSEATTTSLIKRLADETKSDRATGNAAAAGVNP